MRDYEDSDDYDLGPLRHSGPGVASFVLAIGAGLVLGILILVAAVIEASRPGALQPDGPGEVALGLVACFALLLAMIGVGLGIAGVFQKHRKIVFAVIGLVFNGLVLLGGGCLALIGLASGGAF